MNYRFISLYGLEENVIKLIILITTKQNNCFKKENLKDKKLK